MRRFVSQPSELCAGAAFALAGFSSGRGDCARGGWAAGRCVPAGMFRACLTPAVRSCWNVLRSITPAVRSCWNVPRSITPAARFYRGVLRSITPAVRSCWNVLRSITPAVRFCWNGLCPIAPAVRFYRGVLRPITPAVRFCWNVPRSPHARRAFLLECSALASRPPCGSIAVFRACLTPAVRFYRGVLRSPHARRAVLSRCSALGSRLLFDAERQTGRLAISCVSIPRVEIAIRAFSRCWRGYLPQWVHFGFVRLFVAISTGLSGTRGAGNGAGGAV